MAKDKIHTQFWYLCKFCNHGFVIIANFVIMAMVFFANSVIMALDLFLQI